MLLDHDRAVVAVASQPFWLFWPAGEGRVRSHVPDYFARLADGSALVVDCRPVERIKPKDRAAPIVASALGLHRTSTVRQVVNAGSTWSRYATARRPRGSH
jgi:hypothetical protein